MNLIEEYYLNILCQCIRETFKIFVANSRKNLKKKTPSDFVMNTFVDVVIGNTSRHCLLAHQEN